MSEPVIESVLMVQMHDGTGELGAALAEGELKLNDVFDLDVLVTVSSLTVTPGEQPNAVVLTVTEVKKVQKETAQPKEA